MDKMKEKLMKHLAKKGKKLEPLAQEAKTKVLSDLKKYAQDEMKNNLDSSVKKVTVASDDKEGLKEGLEKAKEMLDISDKEECEEDEKSEAEEKQEEMPESLEEIEAKIQKLMELKEKLKSEKKDM